MSDNFITSAVRFLGNLACATTFHQWGNWQYESDNSCNTLRRCQRCGREELSSYHVWSDLYHVSNDSCARERICTRCGETEQGSDLHIWDVWNYESPKSCVQVQFCRRCHLKNIHEPVETEDHDEWGVWQYASNTNCFDFIRYCKRCSAFQQRQENYAQHNWGPYTDNGDGYSVSYCGNCGEASFERVS